MSLKQDVDETEDIVDETLTAAAAAAAAAATEEEEEAAAAAAAAAAASAAAPVVVVEDDKGGAADLYSKWNKNAFGAPVAKQSGKFTKEESELVRRSVEEFCAAKQISTARLCSECDHKAELKGAWMEIAKRIPHRSVQSVYRHGIRRLHPFKRGAWSDAECSMLVELVARLGKKWSTIQGKLNRSADSCRDKYREMSDDYVKGRWKEQETEILKRLIREQVGADPNADLKDVAKMMEENNIQIPWSTISKRMGKRSRLSCFKKWQKLTGMQMDEEGNFAASGATVAAMVDTLPSVAVTGKRKAESTAADPAAAAAVVEVGLVAPDMGKYEDMAAAGVKRLKSDNNTAGMAAAAAATADTAGAVVGGDFDVEVYSAKMADETVEAVGLPDARAAFV